MWRTARRNLAGKCLLLIGSILIQHGPAFPSCFGILSSPRYDLRSKHVLWATDQASEAIYRPSEEVFVARQLGSESPGEALVNSPRLRPALEVLLELHCLTLLDTFLQRALSQLQAGSVNWKELLAELVLSPPLPSEAEIIRRGEVALRLLTIGNNQAEQVIISSGSGQSFEGKIQGASSSHRFRLVRSPLTQRWGQWTNYFVAEGPAHLRGHRLVAASRDKVASVFTQGELDLKPGDTMYLATPDRAAFLEVATFDQLPEFSAELARMIREGIAKDVEVAAPKEMLEAARFVNEVIGLDQVEATQRRFQRLQKSTVVQEAASLIAADTNLAELFKALEPNLEDFYAAARGVALKTRPVEEIKPRQVAILRFNILQLLGLIVILGVIGWGLFQAFNKPSNENLPLYSLSSTEASQTQPEAAT